MLSQDTFPEDMEDMAIMEGAMEDIVVMEEAMEDMEVMVISTLSPPVSRNTTYEIRDREL
jgi:hypothetical protein